MLSILFKSHLFRHSGTGSAFKDTQRAFEHLRHSESTRALGEHSEGTQAPSHLEGPRMLSHLRHLGTQLPRVLKHLGTCALKALRHLATQALGHLGTQSTQALSHLGTRGTFFSGLNLQ